MLKGEALAEEEGFEPSNHLRGYLISSQGRYDHFDTLPNYQKNYSIIISHIFEIIKYHF